MLLSKMLKSKEGATGQEYPTSYQLAGKSNGYPTPKQMHDDRFRLSAMNP